MNLLAITPILGTRQGILARSLLNTGHFALEEGGDVIAHHIPRFMTTKDTM